MNKESYLFDRIRWGAAIFLIFHISLLFILFLQDWKTEKMKWFILFLGVLYVILLYAAYQLIYRPLKVNSRIKAAFARGDSYEDIYHMPYLLNEEEQNMLRRFYALLDKSELITVSKKKSEYLALQNQINPHFLYNTLNTIKSLIELDMNDTAVKAVSSMSSFYRNSLSKGQFIIPLRQELLLTEQYLYIQNLRYMDFVDYEITYEPSWEDHGAEIPKLTIQPVVENIFVHGLTSQICHIHLNVSIRNGTICISVSDNGSGIPPEKLAELNRSIRDFKTARHSFGLPSINHRIALLYGENYGLTIESSPEKGTTVTIVIPDKKI